MILNNGCKDCTKLIETEGAPISENYCHDYTGYPELDKDRLKKFIKTDSYVKFLFIDLKKKGNSPDRSLEILHSMLLEDESLLQSYTML